MIDIEKALRKDIDIEKALTTGSTSGGVLIKEALDPQIADVAFKKAGVYAYFKQYEIPWDTNVYAWDEVSSYAVPRSVSESTAFAASDLALNASGGSKYTKTLASIRIDGQLSKLLNATTHGKYNAWAISIQSAANAMALEIERQYLIGNRGLTATDMDGLCNQLSTEVDGLCAVMSLDLLDDLRDTVELNGGTPSVYIVAVRDHQRLIKTLRQQGLENFQNFTIAGFSKTWQFEMYRGCPIIPSYKMPTDLGNSVDQSMAFCLDADYLRIPVCEPLEFEDVSNKVTTRSMAYWLNTTRTIVMEGAATKSAKLVHIRNA